MELTELETIAELDVITTGGVFPEPPPPPPPHALNNPNPMIKQKCFVPINFSIFSILKASVIKPASLEVGALLVNLPLRRKKLNFLLIANIQNCLNRRICNNFTFLSGS
jgi:hypothetical protein